MIEFKSQIGQDRYFIEEYLGYHRTQKSGTYIDIGCNDGIIESNTYVLNKHFGWTGLLIDANPVKVKEAKVNRPNDIVMYGVLWSTPTELKFEYPGADGRGNSLLARVQGLDHNLGYFEEDFRESRTYWTQTTTLSDLFKRDPRLDLLRLADYVSIDIEGAELECLRGINWDTTHFGFITVEWGMREHYLEEMIVFMQSVGYVVHRINIHDVEFIPKDVDDVLRGLSSRRPT